MWLWVWLLPEVVLWGMVSPPLSNPLHTHTQKPSVQPLSPPWMWLTIDDAPGGLS